MDKNSRPNPYLPQTQNKIEEIQVIRPVIYPRSTGTGTQSETGNNSKANYSPTSMVGYTPVPVRFQFILNVNAKPNLHIKQINNVYIIA